MNTPLKGLRNNSDDTRGGQRSEYPWPRPKPETVAVVSSDLLGSVFFAKYKERTPDPGECRILSVNWEERRIEVTNGACRYYPSFDEIEVVLPISRDA